MSNFMKISPVGAKLFHMDARRDMTTLITRFATKNHFPHAFKTTDTGLLLLLLLLLFYFIFLKNILLSTDPVLDIKFVIYNLTPPHRRHV